MTKEQESTYTHTAYRLARGGAKDPTAQIIALAEEIEYYRARIQALMKGERRQGYDTGDCRIFKCSECGYGVNDIYQADEFNYPVGEFNFCPHCGVAIVEEESHAT